MKDFSEVDMEEKLNLLMIAINSINTSFHLKFEQLHLSLHDPQEGIVNRVVECETAITKMIDCLSKEGEGISPRLHDAEESIDDVKERLSAAEEKILAMENELSLLRGTAQVHEKQIQSAAKKMSELSKRSMSNNIVITGIVGDTPQESCKEKVLKLLREKMRMEISDVDVVNAHRLGVKVPGKLRAVVARCSYDLRQRVFQYTKHLKGLTNENNDPYYVSPQLPEPFHTKNIEQREKIKELKKRNANIEKEEDKIKFEVKRGSLYIDGKQYKQHIFPPTLMDIYEIDSDTQTKIDGINCAITKELEDKKSKFTGYAVRVSNSSDVKLAYKKIKQLSLEADHIIMAYTFKQHSGYHDHGEHSAGRRLSKILADRNAANTAVFVARVYGGLQLGYKRFAHIEKMARDALNELLMM